MYSWPTTSQELTHPFDNSVATESASATRVAEEAPDEVLEVPLLLSRQQMLRLAEVAERQGMTSAQFLRRCISSICSYQPGT